MYLEPIIAKCNAMQRNAKPTRAKITTRLSLHHLLTPKRQPSIVVSCFDSVAPT